MSKRNIKRIIKQMKCVSQKGHLLETRKMNKRKREKLLEEETKQCKTKQKITKEKGKTLKKNRIKEKEKGKKEWKEEQTRYKRLMKEKLSYLLRGEN